MQYPRLSCLSERLQWGKPLWSNNAIQWKLSGDKLIAEKRLIYYPTWLKIKSSITTLLKNDLWLFLHILPKSVLRNIHITHWFYTYCWGRYGWKKTRLPRKWHWCQCSVSFIGAARKSLRSRQEKKKLTNRGKNLKQQIRQKNLSTDHCRFTETAKSIKFLFSIESIFLHALKMIKNEAIRKIYSRPKAFKHCQMLGSVTDTKEMCKILSSSN